MARPRSSDDADAVRALARGFEVLDCYAAARRPLGNAEVAQLTGIPKPTVSRLIATLIALGHLRPATQGAGYELGAGVVRLAEAFLGAIDVRHHARPHVVRLAEECNASAFLGVRDADDMLVVEAGRSRSAVALLGSDVGTRMSLYTSALGRAWLAGVDAATRAAVLAHAPGTRGRAGRALDAALAAAIRDGYAESIGEWHANINAIAVPVRTPGGQVVSFNCGGPAFLMPQQRLESYVLPRLLRAADALARDIGGVAGAALTAQHASTAAPSPADAPPAAARARRAAKSSSRKPTLGAPA
jgi:DNA-binding IclR family transcriptional regulator